MDTEKNCRGKHRRAQALLQEQGRDDEGSDQMWKAAVCIRQLPYKSLPSVSNFTQIGTHLTKGEFGGFAMSLYNNKFKSSKVTKRMCLAE